MAWVVHSDWEGGKQIATLDKKSSQEITVFATGDTDDINAAASAISVWLSPTVPDLFSASGTLMLQRFGPVQRIAPYTFTATATYVDPEGSGSGGRGGQNNPTQLGEYKIDWDISSITVKQTFSEAGKFTAYVDPAYADPNPFGAIGIKKAANGKPTVEGVDVRVAALKFSVSFRIPRSTVSPNYVKNLRAKAFHRNDATWLSFGPKQLLFVASSGSQAVFGDPEIKFDFETDIQVTKTFGSIPAVTKPPHDYLDIVYDTEADNTNKVMISKPIAAYVHEIYPTTSFPALFGFGP